MDETAAAGAALEEAIEGFVVASDGRALVRSFRLLDRLAARVAEAVGEFDALGAWRDDGATSMTAWLRHAARRSGREARRWVATGRCLRRLPVTAQAFKDGDLSSGQVDAIVANLDDEIVPLFAQGEEELVPMLAELAVGDVGSVMQSWAQAARDSLRDPCDPEADLPQRSLHLSRTLDGRGELSGSLDPEARVVAQTALRLAESPDVEGEPARTPARRRADAFVDIMRFFLDHQRHQRGGRHRPHLNVFVEYEDLLDGAGASGAHTTDGTPLDAATVRRLACDTGIHRMVRQGRSSILDYGWTTRTVPANLWAALVARDRHCRFPGCDRPPEWCEAHHVIPWEHGGPTALGNLVLTCTRHHHLLHAGWHAKLRPDGAFEVSGPDGRHRTTHPYAHRPDLWEPP